MSLQRRQLFRKGLLRRRVQKIRLIDHTAGKGRKSRLRQGRHAYAHPAFGDSVSVWSAEAWRPKQWTPWFRRRCKFRLRFQRSLWFWIKFAIWLWWRLPLRGWLQFQLTFGFGFRRDNSTKGVFPTKSNSWLILILDNFDVLLVVNLRVRGNAAR